MDKVRLIPLQRAELEDHLDLQNLNYEYIERALGQLLGAGDLSTPNEGLLSSPSPLIDYSTGLLYLQSFAFCSLGLGSDANGGYTRTPIARIARFDRDSQGHVNYPIDISIISPLSTYYLYCRAVSFETDLAPRRQFSVVTGQEEPITMNTRERERVEFSLLKGTNIPAGDGWCKIATLTSDSSGVIAFDNHSFFDEANSQMLVRFSNDIPEIVLETSSFVGGLSRNNSFTTGLNELLAMFRTQFARILHKGEGENALASDTSKRWFDVPAKSLHELSSFVENLQATVDTNNSLITNAVDPVLRIEHLNFRVEAYWLNATSLIRVLSSSSNPALSSVSFDARVIANTSGDITGNLQGWEFLDLVKRPLVILDDAKDYEVLDYSISPVLGDALGNISEVCSLTEAVTAPDGSNAIYPRDFKYSLLWNNVSTDAPLVGNIFNQLIARTYIYGNPYNPSQTLTENKVIPFALQFDANPVNNGYTLTYDLKLKVRSI
jgi:hypothetical protein